MAFSHSRTIYGDGASQGMGQNGQGMGPNSEGIRQDGEGMGAGGEGMGQDGMALAKVPKYSAEIASRPTRRLAMVHQVQPGRDTLKSALSAASAGDTLVLADGTYTGTGGEEVIDIGFGQTMTSKLSMIEIDKDITIRAQNTGEAVLDGEDTHRVMWIKQGTVALEGLKITRGNDVNNAGLRVSSSDTVSISQTVISHNTADQFAGVQLFGTGTVSISQSVISHNKARNGRGGGLSCTLGTVSVLSCEIHDNEAANGGGVYIAGPFGNPLFGQPQEPTVATLTGCMIHSNKAVISSSTLQEDDRKVISTHFWILDETTPLPHGSLTICVLALAARRGVVWQST